MPASADSEGGCWVSGMLRNDYRDGSSPMNPGGRGFQGYRDGVGRKALAGYDLNASARIGPVPSMGGGGVSIYPQNP